MSFIPSITRGVEAGKLCFKSTHRTQMENQDTQICRDSRSLGNLLVAGELHEGTASQRTPQDIYIYILSGKNLNISHEKVQKGLENDAFQIKLEFCGSSLCIKVFSPGLFLY